MKPQTCATIVLEIARWKDILKEMAGALFWLLVNAALVAAAVIAIL